MTCSLPIVARQSSCHAVQQDRSSKGHDGSLTSLQVGAACTALDQQTEEPVTRYRTTNGPYLVRSWSPRLRCWQSSCATRYRPLVWRRVVFAVPTLQASQKTDSYTMENGSSPGTSSFSVIDISDKGGTLGKFAPGHVLMSVEVVHTPVRSSQNPVHGS